MITKISLTNLNHPSLNSSSLNSPSLNPAGSGSAEKRKNARRYAAMNVLCRGAQTRPCADDCLLVNISRGGAAIESKKDYRNGEKIVLNFPVPQGGIIPVFSEVIHSLSGGFGILYGLKYIESDLSVISELNTYLLKYFNLY